MHLPVASLAGTPRPQVKFQAFAEPVQDELSGGHVPIGVLSISHVSVAGALVVVTSKVVLVVALLVIAGQVVAHTVGVRIASAETAGGLPAMPMGTSTTCLTWLAWLCGRHVTVTDTRW